MLDWRAAAREPDGADVPPCLTIAPIRTEEESCEHIPAGVIGEIEAVGSELERLVLIAVGQLAYTTIQYVPGSSQSKKSP